MQLGSKSSTGGPLFTLGQLPGSQPPAANLSGVTLTVNTQLNAPLSGTVKLGFTLDRSIPTQGRFGIDYTTPAGYLDPAMQFVDSSGMGLGTSYSFTLQPGSSSVTLPTIAPGTVGGQVNLLINTDVPQGGGAFLIAAPKAVVTPGSVQFTNVTAAGFDVELVGIETARTGQNATITFSPTAGSQIRGQTVFQYDISQTMQTWFASSSGLKYGGGFSLTFPFQFDGQVNAIGSVTVQLDNSDPITGKR